MLFPLKAVELLVNCGAEIDAHNHDGETPLHIMARRRRLDCAIVLLSRGAQVNAQSKDGSTPLHQAALVSVLLISNSRVQAYFSLHFSSTY